MSSPQFAPRDDSKPVSVVDVEGYVFSVQKTPGNLFAVVDIRKDREQVAIHDVPVAIRAQLTKLMTRPDATA